MTGKERLLDLGFEVLVSSEFSDIFEKRDQYGDKTAIVFDKKSFEIMIDQTNNGIATSWFLPNDVFVAIFKHSTELGW
jgi:hypothetical protein